MSIAVPIQAYWNKYCEYLIIRYYGVNLSVNNVSITLNLYILHT